MLLSEADTTPPPGPGAGAGDNDGAPYISSWAVGVPGGGVRAPAGVVCTAWRPAAEINIQDGAIDVSTVGVDPDGVRRNLYYRDCGSVRQLVWVRDEDPATIAAIALSDLQRRLIVAPVPDLSPPTVGYVNVETWLATDDPGVLTVTAAIPGLSVTATATVTSTSWSTGDGDGRHRVRRRRCGVDAGCRRRAGTVWTHLHHPRRRGVRQRPVHDHGRPHLARHVAGEQR